MLLCSYELNTLDACWIAVNVWSNSSRCRIVSVYLSRTWCLYTIIMPRYPHNYLLFYKLLDSNLFTHRRNLLSWEKPLVKPMAPGSIFHHINLQSTSYLLFCNLYFSIYKTKIPKIFILLSLSDLTFASGREGIDNPFIALVARFLFVCVGTRDSRVVSYWIDTLVIKNWGKYLRCFAASPFPLQGKNQRMLKR